MTRTFASILFLSAASLAIPIWTTGGGSFSHTGRTAPSGNSRSAYEIYHSLSKPTGDGLPRSLPMAISGELESTSSQSSFAIQRSSNKRGAGDRSTARSIATLTGGNDIHSSATSSSSANAPAPEDSAPTRFAKDKTSTEYITTLAAWNSNRPLSPNSADYHQLATHPADHDLATENVLNLADPKNKSARPIMIPAALQGVDAADLSLTPPQWQAIDQTVDQFVESIGGENQDPADPGYLDRWTQSQPQADALLKARIGWQAFDGIQASAARKTNEFLLYQQTP